MLLLGRYDSTTHAGLDFAIVTSDEASRWLAQTPFEWLALSYRYGAKRAVLTLSSQHRAADGAPQRPAFLAVLLPGLERVCGGSRLTAVLDRSGEPKERFGKLVDVLLDEPLQLPPAGRGSSAQ